MLGVFAGLALILFMTGALFAATDNETIGAVFMLCACFASLLATLTVRE
jgi:hypothetical protein